MNLDRVIFSLCDKNSRTRYDPELDKQTHQAVRILEAAQESGLTEDESIKRLKGE